MLRRRARPVQAGLYEHAASLRGRPRYCEPWRPRSSWASSTRPPTRSATGGAFSIPRPRSSSGSGSRPRGRGCSTLAASPRGRAPSRSRPRRS
jgi:hypothetical protein